MNEFDPNDPGLLLRCPRTPEPQLPAKPKARKRKKSDTILLRCCKCNRRETLPDSFTPVVVGDSGDRAVLHVCTLCISSNVLDEKAVQLGAAINGMNVLSRAATKQVEDYNMRTTQMILRTVHLHEVVIEADTAEEADFIVNKLVELQRLGKRLSAARHEYKQENQP